MKKAYLIAILFAGLGLSAKAQKLEKPRIDKLSGDTTWKTSMEKLYQKSNLMGQRQTAFVYAEKLKSGYALFLSVGMLNGPNSSVFSVPAGAKAHFKLADNSIVVLSNVLSQVSKNSVDQTGTEGYAVPCYPLSKSDIEKLSKSTITFVRVEASDLIFDYDIKEDKANLIAKTVSLIATK
jgi:hypothetical protein